MKLERPDFPNLTDDDVMAALQLALEKKGVLTRLVDARKTETKRLMEVLRIAFNELGISQAGGVLARLLLHASEEDLSRERLVALQQLEQQVRERRAVC